MSAPAPLLHPPSSVQAPACPPQQGTCGAQGRSDTSSQGTTAAGAAAGARSDSQQLPLPGSELQGATHGSGAISSNSGDSYVPPWSRDQCDSLGAGLRVHEGETIYDFCWFPQMTATDPTSCCFASSSRAHPVHLWDACTGELRATYRGYNEVDEVAAAYSLAFTPDGAQLYAGYDKRILAFDVTRPGRDYGTITCSGGPRKGDMKLP
ncbi:hypothetical protein DUNSADRAFT_12213, partial [Dunaliella salina]